MSAAALTPRVRTFIVCDGVRTSRTEAGVFSLKGLRWHAVADTFPFRCRLRLFLLLSSPRKGRFPGYVKVINDRTDRAVFYGEIQPAPTFAQGGELLPVVLPVHVRFPEAGGYTFEVWFFQEATSDVLKVQQPFFVLEREA